MKTLICDYRSLSSTFSGSIYAGIPICKMTYDQLMINAQRSMIKERAL